MKYAVIRNLANGGTEIAFFEDDDQQVPSLFDSENEAWKEVDALITSIDQAIKAKFMDEDSRESREDYGVIPESEIENYI